MAPKARRNCGIALVAGGQFGALVGAILRVMSHHRRLSTLPSPTPDDVNLPITQTLLWASPGLLICAIGVWLIVGSLRRES